MSNYDWNLNGDISHGLWWNKIPYFILSCVSFRNFKETNLKIQYFCWWDESQSQWSWWLILIICSQFCIHFVLFFKFRSDLHPSYLLLKKVCTFLQKTHLLTIYLCDCCKMVICKLRKCTKHRYWSCSVSTLSLVSLLGGIFRVHQRNIYHSETISNVLFIL